MFRNYLKTAIRTLFRNKLYTTLNIAGLTFGISCFLLIGLYIFDELTYDTQHNKAAHIYRVIEHKTVNGESSTIAGAGFKLAEEGNKEIIVLGSAKAVLLSPAIKGKSNTCSSC